MNGSCVLLGCTDTLATNYNPRAIADDGKCLYTCNTFDQRLFMTHGKQSASCAFLPSHTPPSKVVGNTVIQGRSSKGFTSTQESPLLLPSMNKSICMQAFANLAIRRVAVLGLYYSNGHCSSSPGSGKPGPGRRRAQVKKFSRGAACGGSLVCVPIGSTLWLEELVVGFSYSPGNGGVGAFVAK